MDLARVVPVLCSAAAAAQTTRAAVRRGGPGRGAVEEPLAGGLVVRYAEAEPGEPRPLTREQVAALGLSPAALRARAVANLRRLFPDVEPHGGPEVFGIAGGGTHEASLLLDDDLWIPGRLPVDGDLVVAVPSRDVLMATGSRSAMGLARLRQLAREIVAKSDYALTGDLLVRRGGRWEVLPGWTPPVPAGASVGGARASGGTAPPPSARRGCLGLLRRPGPPSGPRPAS